MNFDFDRKRWDDFGWNTFLGFLFFYGLFVNFYLAVHLACNDCLAVVAQLNYVIPWLLMLNIVFFLFTFLRSRKLWIWLLPGLVFFLIWYGPDFLPQNAESADGIEVRAMTFNTLKTVDDDKQMPGIITNVNPDIVALQEVSPDLRDTLESELRDEYPYQIYEIPSDRKYEGMAILSRYEILSYEVVTNKDPAPSDEIALDLLVYMRAEIDVDGTRIAVYNFHPPIPQFTPLIKYDASANWWHINQFLAAARDEPLPMLMMCDCNVPPRSKQHHALDDVLNDAQDEKGWSLGMTFMAFPRNIAGLTRIDYIWYSAGFEALEVDVLGNNALSDHMPLFVRFDLQPDSPADAE